MEKPKVDLSRFGVRGPGDDIDVMDEFDPVIGWSVGRPTGRGGHLEFFDKHSGRWWRGGVKFEKGVKQNVCEKIMYDTKEAALAAISDVDDSGTARAFAVIRPTTTQESEPPFTPAAGRQW